MGWTHHYGPSDVPESLEWSEKVRNCYVYLLPSKLQATVRRCRTPYRYAVTFNNSWSGPKTTFDKFRGMV